MTLPRILVLHAYSADNAGDGLLVRETLELLHDALGEVEVTMLASRPDSFADLPVTSYPTVPTKRGWDARTRAILKDIDSYDLVVGVGGGYLRTGTPIESAKTLLVMGPQLRAAARSKTPSLYLPQSIGPTRFGTNGWMRRQLRGIDTVMVRDDRSLSELAGPTLVRMPDLATSGATRGRQPGVAVDPIPVLSIRAIRGKINPDIYRVADALGTYDAYTQSTIGGNDDRPAMATLKPRTMIDRGEIMTPGGTPRVIVAVRLHAALMALAAGHYVVHLAYERKGFGAFGDLGISPWVHSVNTFDADEVVRQAQALLTDPAVRQDYDERIRASQDSIAAARSAIVDRIRQLCPPAA